MLWGDTLKDKIYAFAKINPLVFSKYLEDTGWLRFRTKRKDIRIYQKDCEKFFQVTIPMDDKLSDYNFAMFEACKKVAEYEGGTLRNLLFRLEAL